MSADPVAEERPTVLLVRHGETVWNASRRIQGHEDIPLSDVGRAQARALAERLRREKPARIVSSDLARARETAEIVAAPLGLPVTTDALLREQSLGTWQGLTFAEAAARDPDIARRFAARDPDARPPSGETRAELAARAFAAVSAHASPGSSGPLVIVTHGGVVMSILTRVLGLPPSSPRRLLLPNAGVSTLLHHRGSWFALSVSDVSHLPSSPGETFPFE